MLRSLRDGAKQGFLKYILLGFLVLAGGGLVLTDVGGFFRGGVGATDIAKVGNLTIDLREFDNNARRVLVQSFMTPQDAYSRGILNQILQSEINVRLFAIGAHDLGIKISDEEIARQILAMTQNIAQTDESRKAALQRILRQQGISEQEFIGSLRQETANTLLREQILKGAEITPTPLLETLYEYEHETRRFDVISLDNTDITDIAPAEDETLQSYYDNNKLRYLIPETRIFTIAVLNSEMLKDKVEISEEEIREYYDNALQAYTVPERRILEQVIAQNEADAQAILTKIETDGLSLKDAVEQNSDLNLTHQSPDSFEKSGLMEDISDPTFTAQTGSIIGPVETPLGWHIISVNEVLPPQTLPFDEVRDDIIMALQQDRLLDEMIDTANAIDDQIAGGATLEGVVEEFGLTTQTIGPLRDTGLKPDGEDSLSSYPNDRNDILNTVFDIQSGEIAPILELSDGRFATIRLDEISPQSFKPFEEVRGDIETRWTEDQKAIENRERAQTLFEKIQNNEKSLGDVAKETQKTIKNTEDLRRGTLPDSILPGNAVDIVFTLKEDDVALIPSEKGYLMVQVTDITLPSLNDDNEEERAPIEQALNRVMPQETLNQYLNHLAQDNKVRVNQKLMEQTYSFADEGL